MNKLRSDSAFCQLTPEQVEALDGWFFEERLGYKVVLEKLKGEFGFETSLTGVRRFYKRLEMERARTSLMDAVEMSSLATDALKSGTIKSGMLLLANKCVFELLMQSAPPIREVTTLLRAITSAEAHTMRQTVFEREESERKEIERVRKARESWRMTPQDIEEEKEELRRERAERRKAKQAAKDKEKSGIAKTKAGECGHISRASSMNAKPVVNLPTPHPALSPLRGEGEEAWGQFDGSRREVQLQGVLSPKSGEGDGKGGAAAPHYHVGEGNGMLAGFVDGLGSKEADAVLELKVLESEEREYAEDPVPEEVENRLAPLNAA